MRLMPFLSRNTHRHSWLQDCSCLPRSGQVLALVLAVLAVLLAPSPARAAPGLCVGPVCGDDFHRNPTRSYQLRLRLSDQRGHHERITVDCRDGRISPEFGPVERGYGAAVARRACRLSQIEGPQA